MKTLLLALALLIPLQAVSVEHDSVYTWGKWAKGIQPAAGPVANAATPAPVQLAEVNFRPNESSIFTRPPGPVAPTPATPTPPVAINRVNPSSTPTTFSQDNPRNRR